MCGTPSAALARRRPAGVDRRRADRPAGRRRRRSWPSRCATSSTTAALRERLGDGRRRPRARELHLGPHGAREPRRARARGRGRARRRCAPRCAARRPLKAAGLAAATLASNAIALLFTVALRAAARRRRLRLAGRAALDLPDPRRPRLGAAGRRSRARSAPGTLGDGAAAGGDARRVAAHAAARARRRRRRARCCCASRSPTLLGRRAGSGRRPRRCPTGCLWLLLSIERGALQGVHAYREVGWSIVLEASGGSSPGSCSSPPASASPAPPRHAASSMAITAVALAFVMRAGGSGVADGGHGRGTLRDARGAARGRP